jgi:DNA polymerase-3 subunit gamma/tau
MDVAEIDAASHRGIDDVRDRIIDTVAFQPSQGTRRVYILDEAHQLTKEAFNALLKTIEEPPAHVLFVFCTTESHKMMATVRDRCQRFALAPAGSEQLLTVLSRICERENIQADEQALRAVARAAQGSFRNAVGLLEMLSTAYGTTFTHADVLAHLGAVSEDVLLDVTQGVLDGDAAHVLRTTEQLAQDGGDVEQFGRELAEHLRTLLLVRHGIDPASLGIGNVDRLVEQARTADEARIVAAIDCIADAITRVRVGTDPRLAIETALVRACQGLGLPSLALRLAVVEHRERGTYGDPLPAPTAVQARPVPVTARAATRAAATSSAPAIAAETTAASPAPSSAGSVELSAIDEWWPRFVQAANADAPMRPTIQQLVPIGIEDGRVVLESPQAGVLPERMQQVICDRIAEIVGEPVRIDLRAPGSDSRDTTPPAPPVADTPSDDAAAPPEVDAVELLRTTFNATEVTSQ